MILVTGHRGFVGGAAVRELERRGLPHRRFDGDVRDRSALRRGLDGCTAVLHLAARHEDRDRDGLRVHPAMATALVEVARERGVARVVGSSTAGVWGHGAHRGTSERTPEAPDGDHARSRAEADRILLGSGLSVTVVRPRFVLGPGDRSVGPLLARLPAVPDGGRARWSVVHVDDLARVLIGLVGLPSPPVLIAEDGHPPTVHELVAHHRGAPPLSWPGAWLPSRVRTHPRVRFLLEDQVFDGTLLRTAFPSLAPGPAVRP